MIDIRPRDERLHGVGEQKKHVRNMKLAGVVVYCIWNPLKHVKLIKTSRVSKFKVEKSYDYNELYNVRDRVENYRQTVACSG